MYHVVTFKQGQPINHMWVRNEQALISLLKEGWMAFRTGTSQVATLVEDKLMWQDLLSSDLE